MKRNFMLALDKISIREHRHSVVVPVSECVHSDSDLAAC